MTEPVQINLPPMEPMLTAVGAGIQAFSGVEMFLSQIFAMLLHPAPGPLCMIALDAGRHIETKLRMTRAVGKERLNADTLPEFNKLMERIKDRTGMRHKLAHWRTSHWHPKGDLLADGGKGVEVRLIPNYFTAQNLDFFPKDTIRLAQIDEFRDASLTLAADLIKFIQQLQVWIKEAQERGDIYKGKVGRQKVGSAKTGG